jgi:Cdc6-like AAA superfamily ATPase
VGERGQKRLTLELIRDVADEVHEAVHDLHVRSLGTHQRALYTLIRDAGSVGIRSSKLHSEYEQRVQSPRSRSMRRRYLQSLQRYELISKSGRGKGTRYRVTEAGQTFSVNS